MSEIDPPSKKLAPRPILVQALKEMHALGPDNPRMQEVHFREFIKALFNPTTEQFDTALWFRTTGNLRKGIDVVDAGGALLFRTPPMTGTIQTNIGVRRGESMAAIADQAALNERRHAALGQQTLTDGLTHYKFGQALSPRDAWLDILARYGLIKHERRADGSAASTHDVPLVGHEEEL